MSEQAEEVSFEVAFAQLERIVTELERGNLDLSGSLASYERAVGLLARCQSLLDGVDRSVALLTGVDADGNPITAAFDASATAVSVAPPVEIPKAKPKAATSRKASPSVQPPTVFGTESNDIDPPF